MRPDLGKHRILLKEALNHYLQIVTSLPVNGPRTSFCHAKADLFTTKLTLETQRDLHEGL